MKQSSIIAAIDEQEADRVLRLGMKRDVLPSIPAINGFATIVTGVRRAGKSTVLDQWIERSNEKVLAVHFDDLKLSSFATEDFQHLYEILQDREMRTLVLDEVQDVSGWERFVTGCLDRKIKVLVTGPNAKLLSREFGTKLTGRHLNVEMFPFSYAEYLRYTEAAPTAMTIDDYLNVGGFPAYVASRDRRILTELFNDILYRDIVVRYALRDAAPIKSLATYLLGHVGSRISPSRLKDSIHVSSSATVLEYFNYLEETYLIQRISLFASSPKASLSAPKKVYACDTGLVSAVEAVDNVNLGHKLENLVYLKIRDPEKTVNYFLNDSDETECDFIVENRDGSREAIQVAWALEDDNEAREVNGLKHAMDRFGLKESVIVTRDQQDVIREDGKTIRVLPAWKFLTDGC